MLSFSAVATGATSRYALILADEPVVARYPRAGTAGTSARAYRATLESRQRALKNELRSRAIPVTGSVSAVLNAVFVSAPDERRSELQSLPGVKGVVKLRVRRPKLNTAINEMKAPGAWAALGGMENAGKGMRIAILDTGIESTHPAFQDPSLPMPEGFPRCSGGNFDCSKFTNNKVIVARSYVDMIAAGSAPDPAADSRPDDYTPRDRIGHGTATASCAAAANNKGAVAFSGMAPKAYIGNYKITGSPMVNEGAPDDVTIQAAEDAWNDGMDVISYSFGGSALTGPLETGDICGNPKDVPCDLVATTFENLTKQGIVIVAAAGNEGDLGYNTIDTPANAPGIIAAGALTNVHAFVETLSVVGGPSTLQNIPVDTGDGSPFPGAVTAPLRDVSQVGDDGYACSAIPVGYLAGTVALIARGPSANACTFSTKIGNALDAGAVAVVVYDYPDGALGRPSGFANWPIPAVFVSNAAGIALKEYVAAHPGAQAVIDPNAIEQAAPGNRVASFSSTGPAGGALKPDVLATGTEVYMAAETYDPFGILYSSTGYASAGGTSFATPIVAGAAALVRQKHPDWSAGQVKSAIVNTASQDITGTVTVVTAGAGKLDAAAAVNATVTVVPATVSFDILQPSSLPLTQRLQVTNTGSAAVSLNAAVRAIFAPAGATVAVDKSTLSLAPGASDVVAVTLSGTVPASGGVYYGAVTLAGSGVSLRVPYMFAVATGVPSAIIPLTGDNFSGTVGQGIAEGIVSFKLIDGNGVPVPGYPVTWDPGADVSVEAADSSTDANGVAAAQIVLGSTPGTYSVTARISRSLTYRFSGTAHAIPTIASASSVLNAGDLQPGAVAPGSFIAIKGSDLADFTDVAYTPNLPIAIDYTAVSFDAPGLSIAAPITYVSPAQVNVQVPWEFQGVDAAKVKVRIDYTNGTVVTVPLKPYAPALFQVGGGAAAAQLAADYSLITAAHPAARGQEIVLYANGLGPVTNQPATGAPAGSGPALSETTTRPVVTIGGRPAAVNFSGLTPGLAALYQLNVIVPADAPAGAQPVTVAIGGVTSAPATVVIQ